MKSVLDEEVELKTQKMIHDEFKNISGHGITWLCRTITMGYAINVKNAAVT
jgi:hypothetical protein